MRVLRWTVDAASAMEDENPPGASASASPTIWSSRAYPGLTCQLFFAALAHRHARHRKIAIDTYAHEWIEGSSVSTKKPRKSTGPDSALMLREEHPPASRSQRDVCIINSVSLRSSYPETTSGWAFHRAITSHVTMLPSATCE